MNLLAELPQHNYPTDYLLARIKGRKSSIITDWTVYRSMPLPEHFTQKEIWHLLLQEFRWVYLRMNKELRTTAAPLFFYFELRTLILCLRFKIGLEDEKCGELLTASLLPNTVQTILKNGTGADNILYGLANYFTAISNRFTELPETFQQEGLKGIERMLLRCYLEYIVATKLHPVIKTFFKHLIDFHNIMGLAKCFRWEITTPPSFINGGTIPSQRLTKSLSRGTFTGVAFHRKPRLTRPITGEELALLEISLLRDLTKYQQRSGRNPTSMNQIIDYLWRRYIETRNIGLITHRSAISEDLLAKELIQ